MALWEISDRQSASYFARSPLLCEISSVPLRINAATLSYCPASIEPFDATLTGESLYSDADSEAPEDQNCCVPSLDHDASGISNMLRKIRIG
jgi:hypothetical protein